MKSPCIAYPENEPLVLIRASQVRICDGNHCAAALLSYFGYWHDVRLNQRRQAEHVNKVAELHKEEGVQETTLLQYHTQEDIETDLLHLYGRKTIRVAIALLIRKGFLSLHANPNPRYRFDKTHYFLFYPGNVQAQVHRAVHEVKVPHREGKITSSEFTENGVADTDNNEYSVHEVKVPHREGENAASSGKNASPITEITYREDLRENKDPLSIVSPQPEKRHARSKASVQPNTAYTPGFKTVWGLYPRKESKVEAFAIWHERGLEKRAAEIAEKITRLKETLWADKEVKYIPLPTTWLNQARYEDDLVPHEAVRRPMTKMDANHARIKAEIHERLQGDQNDARDRQDAIPLRPSEYGNALSRPPQQRLPQPLFHDRHAQRLDD